MSEEVHKARFVSDLVKEQEITSVVDWGCGDGETLEKLDLHGIEYTGVVASEEAVERMRKRFAERPEHTFTLPRGWERWERWELALGADALPHCPDDAAYEDGLKKLFESSRRFVLICTANGAKAGSERPLRPRPIAADVSERFPEWELRWTEPAVTAGPRSFFLYEKTG